MTDRIVLVSSDEKKAKLITEAGVPCFVFPSLIKEREFIRQEKDITAREAAIKLSEKKAADVGYVYPDIFTVAVAQTLDCEGKIILRPESMEDIRDDLRTLSGKKCTLYSVTTIYGKNKKAWQEVEKTDLTYKKMTNEQIDALVEEFGPSILRVLGSVKKENFPHLIEEENLNFEIINGLPVRSIIQFFKTLRV